MFEALQFLATADTPAELGQVVEVHKGAFTQGQLIGGMLLAVHLLLFLFCLFSCKSKILGFFFGIAANIFVGGLLYMDNVTDPKMQEKLRKEDNIQRAKHGLSPLPTPEQEYTDYKRRQKIIEVWNAYRNEDVRRRNFGLPSLPEPPRPE